MVQHQSTIEACVIEKLLSFESLCQTVRPLESERLAMLFFQKTSAEGSPITSPSVRCLIRAKQPRQPAHCNLHNPDNTQTREQMDHLNSQTGHLAHSHLPSTLTPSISD